MSRSPSVKYHRLSEDLASDDEDEGFGDNILFDSRLVNGTTTDNRNIFEMEQLGLPRIRASKGYYVNLTKRRRWCLAISLIFLLISGTVCGVLIPFLRTGSQKGTVTPINESIKSASDWNRTFYKTWTESSVYLMDLNMDRLDDILIGLANQKTIEGVLNKPDNITMRQYCKSIGVDYPCGGTVAAFKGTDGTLLWQTNTRSVIIHQACVDLEIAGDMKHCMLTGRHSTCQSVESFTGRIQWVVDPEDSVWSSHFVIGWNVYQAVDVPDLDGDGVLDLLVSHGGDKDKEPWDHDREAGRLILLSGLTGRPIGSHYLQLPDSKETYMPPIKYVTPTGAIYILIGTGGETVQGSLFAISLPDLYLHVTGSKLKSLEASTEYNWLEKKPLDKFGFAELYSGLTKGIMVPPVVADTDSDGFYDLLITTFDGQVALVDGKSLTEVWSQSFDGMETYSSPAPGFFNGDSKLDWLVHFNQGVWDKYNSSETMILDGKDGSILWSSLAESYAYSSDLSVQIEGMNSHMFITKFVGMNSSLESVQESIGLKKRHLGQPLDNANPLSTSAMSAEEFQAMCSTVAADLQQRHVSCDQDLDSLTQDVLLMDHTLRHHPLRILQQKAERFHYQLDHEPGTFHCNSLSERHKDKINMCLVLTPTSYTGAVGDVDGDDHFDYVHVSQLVGTQRSDTLSPTGSVSEVILSKHNLKSVLVRKDFVHLDTSLDNTNSNSVFLSDEQGIENEDDNDDNDGGGGDDGAGGGGVLSSVRHHVDSIVFRPLQGWCQYLGCAGDSWYRVPPL